MTKRRLRHVLEEAIDDLLNERDVLRAQVAQIDSQQLTLRNMLEALTAERDHLACDKGTAEHELRCARADIAAANADMVATRNRLAERDEALRIALEQAGQVSGLRAELAKADTKCRMLAAIAASSTDCAEEDAEVIAIMAAVGDRMAAKVDTQTAKEWEAAKEGRSLRGPDGRWLKAEATS